jgi:carbamoyl-phosphate synthase large subunit
MSQEMKAAVEWTTELCTQWRGSTRTIQWWSRSSRASRSFPFVSKITGTNFAAEATNRMLGLKRVLAHRRRRPDARR